MTIKLKKINNTIIKCKKCPRLVSFIKKISIQKRKQNKNEKYWGKPVPGFGDNKAKLMILGLAPAAHGGTRTGRAFTGDRSGNFLFKSLFLTGISNQDFSEKANDNLKLHDSLQKLVAGKRNHINQFLFLSNIKFITACNWNTGDTV